MSWGIVRYQAGRDSLLDIITIERDNFIDNSIYIKDLEDKIVKGVVDNIDVIASRKVTYLKNKHLIYITI